MMLRWLLLFVSVGLVVVSSSASSKTCDSMFSNAWTSSIDPGFPEPSKFSKYESARLLEFLTKDSVSSDRLKKVDALLKSLGNVPAVKKTPFSRGYIYVDSRGLIWANQNGDEFVLVRSQDLKGRTFGAFLVSPDGKKIAYSTTDAGADVSHWSILTIDKIPKRLIKKPIVMRRRAFSWSKDSKGIYYSKYLPKNQRPIVKHVYFALATEKETVVFDHGSPHDYAIVDLDGGQTLLAQKYLGPAFGIKTLFSAFKGVRKSNGNYHWSPVVPGHKYVSHLVRSKSNDKVILQTNQFGSNYGLIEFDLNRGQEKSARQLIPPHHDWVLHNSQFIANHYVLQYNDPKTRNIYLRIYDDELNLKHEFRPIDVGLPDEGFMSLMSGIGNISSAYFSYSDLVNGNTTLVYDFNSYKVHRLKDRKSNPYNMSRVRTLATTLTSEDGAEVPVQVLYPVDVKGSPVKPNCVFVRTYGAISIINRPEVREAQMALSMGCAYVTASVRGGGELGADWFLEGATDKLKTISDIASVSRFITDEFAPFRDFGLTSKDMVSLGRSWGGLHALLLAALYPHTYEYIFSIVPVVDLEKMLTEGWFGRVAHSDLAPKVDPKTGHWILDRSFWKKVESANAALMENLIARQNKLFINISQKDDRVDQTAISYELAMKLRRLMPEDSFHFFEREGVSHGDRSYQTLVFTLLANHYKIDL